MILKDFNLLWERVTEKKRVAVLRRGRNDGIFKKTEFKERGI